eukprot:TRINITY_DN4285_c0_g1_i1.p1 TRINITY_DN4285_c0_g1~~TRINITY_DN4285_c0_g1_i1.p1  ORF type:complete len:577 (+),score=73.65 TRINITY_DN4285_c0_g1_i1:150-1880(+)
MSAPAAQYAGGWSSAPSPQAWPPAAQYQPPPQPLPPAPPAPSGILDDIFGPPPPVTQGHSLPPPPPAMPPPGNAAGGSFAAPQPLPGHPHGPQPPPPPACPPPLPPAPGFAQAPPPAPGPQPPPPPFPPAPQPLPAYTPVMEPAGHSTRAWAPPQQQHGAPPQVQSPHAAPQGLPQPQPQPQQGAAHVETMFAAHQRVAARLLAEQQEKDDEQMRRSQAAIQEIQRLKDQIAAARAQAQEPPTASAPPAGGAPSSVAAGPKWRCSTCSAESGLSDLTCRLCGRPRAADGPRPEAPQMWTCPQCYCSTNPGSSQTCKMCLLQRPSRGASLAPPPHPPAPPASGGRAPPAAGEWECPTCTLHNRNAQDECQACSHPRPGAVRAQDPGRPAPPPPRPPSDTWSCRVCTLDNAADAQRCSACDAPGPHQNESADSPPDPAARQPAADDAGRSSWVEDSSATLCSGCRAAFSVVRRRHHCRACGDVFCHACSNRRAVISEAETAAPPPSSWAALQHRVAAKAGELRGRPESGSREVRVCNACWAERSERGNKGGCDCPLAEEGFHRPSCSQRRGGSGRGTT